MADGPVGDVVQTPIWFTHCVDKADFEPTPSGIDTFLGGVGMAAKKGCDFLLGGKLVCLDGTKCAVGTIIHIEPVGYQKSGFETIDNDFCVNILLFPHEVDHFSGSKLSNWDKVRKDGVQGGLVNREPGDMPTPAEPASDPTPYAVTYLIGAPGGDVPYERNEDKTEALLEEVKQDAAGIKRIDIPVLHCEFEGSRAFTVCSALAPFFDAITGGPGAGACRAAIGWIPFFGGLVCSIVEALIALALAPIMAAVAAAAWAASGINDELFLTGPISRQVSLGEPVIVTGRWTWDGGHSGWNEFHPTFTLQKVVFPEKTTAGFPTDQAKALVDEWCRLVGQVPPSTGEAASGLVNTVTTEQQEVEDRQKQPEHKWEFHPAIDGCLPVAPDDGEIEPPR